MVMGIHVAHALGDARDQKAETPTWSSGPDGLALLAAVPLRTTPLSLSTSTSMPCADLADMPAFLSALATTREGADAAPRMEREDDAELGLLAIAESAWYAAMGGGVWNKYEDVPLIL